MLDGVTPPGQFPAQLCLEGVANEIMYGNAKMSHSNFGAALAAQILVDSRVFKTIMYS